MGYTCVRVMPFLVKWVMSLSSFEARSTLNLPRWPLVNDYNEVKQVEGVIEINKLYFRVLFFHRFLSMLIKADGNITLTTMNHWTRRFFDKKINICWWDWNYCDKQSPFWPFAKFVSSRVSSPLWRLSIGCVVMTRRTDVWGQLWFTRVWLKRKSASWSPVCVWQTEFISPGFSGKW